MKVFRMDLPQRQKAFFQNQRIFTVVILENIPQFCLQIAYLAILSNDPNFITIFSMIFSLLSIVLTFFEYCTKKYLFDSESMIVVKIDVHSKSMSNMSYNEFKRKIANKRNTLTKEIGKMISIDANMIEMLKPIRSPEGAMFAFYIRNNDSIDYNKLIVTLATARDNGTVGKAIRHAYSLHQACKIQECEVKRLVSADFEAHHGRATIAAASPTTTLRANMSMSVNSQSGSAGSAAFTPPI